jgi:hypothetical protein
MYLQGLFLTQNLWRSSIFCFASTVTPRRLVEFVEVYHLGKLMRDLGTLCLFL